MERFWLSLCFILLIPLLGCNRPLTGSSTLTIQVPKTLGKVGVLEALPANRKACYGVSITAEDIPTQIPNTCSPKTGILAGFVEPGQSISASVPRGTNRSIQLYVFLEAPGENTPCPRLQPNFSAKQLLNTYLVATKEGIDITKSEVVVNITMNFPGVAQTLAQTLGAASSCTTLASGVVPSFGVSAGRSVGVGTPNGAHLKSRVGSIHTQQVLTSPSGTKLYLHE